MSARNAQLRKLLARKEILMAPGTHDALTARIAEMCGFEAVYMSGAGTVNTQLGLPDHSIITLTEMVQSVGRLARATKTADYFRCGYGVWRGVERHADGTGI